MQATVQRPEDMPAAFARGLESGDIEQLACLYADEAAVRTSEGQVVHGIAGIREVFQGLLARKARFDGKVRWSVAVGDVALIIVDWKSRETKHNGEIAFFTGTSTHVLGRGADGGWRFLIMNPNGTVGTADSGSSDAADVAVSR